jgi:two-component system sensor histidine kinase HydH
MKSRKWIELLIPTILIGLAWLGLSLTTTIYISWLERRHGEVLSENVASICAAAEMQHVVWELHISTDLWRAAEKPDPAPSSSLMQLENRFRIALRNAFDAAIMPEERQLVTALHERFEHFTRELDGAREAKIAPAQLTRATALAAEMAELCDQLRRMNQHLIQQRTSEHLTWSLYIRSTRLLFVILGPMIGIWLGYRVASSFRRRLSAIRVSLEGVSSELGNILVEPSTDDVDLDAIDRQVRAIAGRLHEVVVQLEGARREAICNERLAAVGQLAAGVAHELRNPLTAVKLLVQTASLNASSDNRSLKQLTVAQDEISRMERTIQNLMDFAKPASVQRLPHDLRNTICRAINLVQGRARQDEIQIESAENDGPLPVLGDPEQLHQVFVNLLLNGMDAMPNGGVLKVELRRHSAPGHDDSACEVAVIDQGSGIPPDLLNHIFEPFVTTKTRGTGLGLAISKRLIEEHGGQLMAGNHSQGGAVFTVRLPCCSSETESLEHSGSEIMQL